MPERRRDIRMPVDAWVAYRTVGMRGFELCEVREVSTRAMQITLDRRLANGAIVTIAVQQAEHGRPRRLYTYVLRTAADGNRWKHVIVASSRRSWPPTLIVDVACSTADSRQVRSLKQWLAQ